MSHQMIATGTRAKGPPELMQHWERLVFAYSLEVKVPKGQRRTD
jgi:hypothetical protein